MVYPETSTFAPHLAGHGRLAKRLQCSAAGVRLGWCKACNATGGRCEAGRLELRCVLITSNWEGSSNGQSAF